MDHEATLSSRSRKRRVASTLNWHWRVFSPGGVVRTRGHYVKLVYGILGLGFLVYTAVTVSVGASEPRLNSAPPSAWYWQWVVNLSEMFKKDVGAARERESIFNEGDDIFMDTRESVGRSGSAAVSWGTDDSGESLRYWMGKGAADYIRFGLAAALLGILGGLGWATLTEWPSRPGIPLPYRLSAWQKSVRSVGRVSLEMIDSIPRFLLLLAIFAIGQLSVEKFTIGMAVFLMFGTTVLFQDRIAAFLTSERYHYALELGLSPTRIFFVHLLRRRLFPLLLVQLPYMVSTFILWESTLAYLDWGVLNHSWGHLIRLNFRFRVEDLDWAFLIPMVSLLFVVSSLYILGDALRERIEPNE